MPAATDHPALDRDGLATQRREAVADLCAGYRVSIMYAFGSRGSDVHEWLLGRSQKIDAGGSDVDIGVKMMRHDKPRVWDKVRLAVAIEDLFGVGRVDLVCLDDADPFLAANIIRGERLFAADSREADEYDLYVLRRAGDLAPHERERLDSILGTAR